METETITRVMGGTPIGAMRDKDLSLSWWSRYKRALDHTGLSETALRIVDLDSDYLVEQGIFGAGHHASSESRWPATRLRRGLVMGSVQSGKTASLLAVTAKAIDRGVNIVVILGGTRLALWRQTYERVVSQLDCWSAEIDSARRAARVLLPSPKIVAELGGMPDLASMYFETPNLVRRMLLQGSPIVAVVMKHEDHLLRFGGLLHEVFKETFGRSDVPLHMLVVDDEADDGSILDKEVEAGISPDSDGHKQLPRHIARLWAAKGPSHETCYNKLFATYLAYTATPQANFLQSTHNPLSPSDFVAALRVPFELGSIEAPRSSTFAEPLGISRYYTGGEMFYRRMSGAEGALCVSSEFPLVSDAVTQESHEAAVKDVAESQLSDALRAYFVSGAIGLLISGRRLEIARTAPPASREEIKGISPKPHSMLYHPSARIGDHFLAAQEIAGWSSVFDPQTPKGHIPRDLTGYPVLSVEGLRARLAIEEELWKGLLGSFEESRHRLSFMPGGHVFRKVEETQWPELKAILMEDVFPHARLTIINSDPRTDDRPRFEPEDIGEGRFIAGRDLFTIFVSGNVMARGITLEGLATTLFLRSANEPLADSQMQMQRWFGYRGEQLPRCRIFLFRDQFELFRAYHEADEALRNEIISEMNSCSDEAPSPLVLQGAKFRATGKIANLRALPLCPGPDPFIRVIETGSAASHNVEVLGTLLETETWEDVVVGGILRGKAMKKRYSLTEVAALLESFRYSNHDPNPLAPEHARWRAIASEVRLEAPEAPLFRPPGASITRLEAVNPPSCPYSIAAYLRLWSALLTRRARGMYPTDDIETPWSMIDLRRYSESAPTFLVGIRYGSAGLCDSPRLRPYGVLRMDRQSKNGVLVSTWGSRNPGEGEGAYLGDQLFDYHVHLAPPPVQEPGEPLWRPRGAPGLVLFHVIRGDSKAAEAVTVGLGLPAGGPDHIAALRTSAGK